MNILVCTLGASWAVIPEILGWLAPELLDLYKHHPQRHLLDELRSQHQLQPPDELWICTTEGKQTQDSLAQLQRWWQAMDQPLPLRIWTAAGTDQLASQSECARIRELTLRATLLASERVAQGKGQLVLSLAGGRKTMSADLQTAGGIFGAHALLHVVGPDPLPAELIGRDEHKAHQPSLLAQPLPAKLAQAIMPLVAGVGQRSELLDLEFEGQSVNSQRFGLPLPDPGQVLSWAMPGPPAQQGQTLFDELQTRQQKSADLMGNFLAQVAKEEHHENWRSLYRLAPRHIQALRQTRLGSQHRQWLQELPKADLHRHIGGCLDLSMQRQVAQAIWQSMDTTQRQHSLQTVQALLDHLEWPHDWPRQLKQPGSQRAECTATLLLHASEHQLQHNLFDVTEPRIGLKHRTDTPIQGFAAYERPGELSGSALLCHPAAIAAYAQAIVQQARDEGLRYLELRGSPHKYREEAPEQFLLELRQALEQAGADTSPRYPLHPQPLRIGFIWILDRRHPDKMQHTVQQAVQAQKALEGFLLGLDLAGDEGTNNPQQLATAFDSAFVQCLPITIHAGEGESAENIWQAAYHLHADRVGHGLTLAEHPALVTRFRDKGICLELCPSSNREVVGFHDPLFPASADHPSYPLRKFLERGLSVTLCTDNPGISRTTLADEYLVAARMSEQGLTQWEALALIRQSFVHAFLPSTERETLLKAADQETFRILSRTL